MIIQKLKFLASSLSSILFVAFILVGFSLPVSAAPAPVDGANSAVDCGRDNGNLAGPPNPNCVTQPVDPLPSKEPDLVKNYVNPFIKLLTALVGIAVVIGIIYGGIEYAMSAGDPQKAAVGKNRIRNAIIGLVAYVLTLAFLNFIIPGGILGVNV